MISISFVKGSLLISLSKLILIILSNAKLLLINVSDHNIGSFTSLFLIIFFLKSSLKSKYLNSFVLLKLPFVVIIL